MPVTVVVGAQWGDEGKAKVIDLLAAEHTHVVRYQGGHNAGHTVVVGSERYALQLIPSGVLYPHIIPVIGNGVVVDLPTLFKEIDTLQSRDIDCSRLLVSSQCHLIFPWHQSLDSLYEQGRGDTRIGLLEHDEAQAMQRAHPPHAGQERVGVRPLKAGVGEDHGVHVGGSERPALGDELALDEQREHRQGVAKRARDVVAHQLHDEGLALGAEARAAAAGR